MGARLACGSQLRVCALDVITVHLHLRQLKFIDFTDRCLWLLLLSTRAELLMVIIGALRATLLLAVAAGADVAAGTCVARGARPEARMSEDATVAWQRHFSLLELWLHRFFWIILQ